MLNYESSKGELPPGVVQGQTGPGQLYFNGWTREIMPYAEDEQLRQLYNDTAIDITTTNTTKYPNIKRFRETLVPMYQCPTDHPSELIVPDSGPASGNPGVPFRTSSYRGCAGRSDGYTTWDLWEDLPTIGQVMPSGLHRGWRGPLVALYPPKVTPPANHLTVTTAQANYRWHQ